MPRKGVQYVQNDEPSFITDFKQKVGYKDGPNVKTKHQIPDFSDSEEEEVLKEDEKPVVVVLKTGDLTAEEADTEQRQIDEGPARLDEKISFKKPKKRTKEEPDDTENSTPSSEPSKKKKVSKGANKIQSSLLSFGDEEEDEET